MKKRYGIVLHIILFVLVASIAYANHPAVRKRFRKSNPRVLYRDINIAMNVKKVLYFDFDLGKVETTNTQLFKIDVYKKAEKKEVKRDHIIFYGLQSGSTDLWVYDNKEILRYVYNITITEENLKRILGHMKQMLKGVEGFNMYIREHKIILDGEILLPGDIARIHQVMTGFPNVFKIQYRMSPVLFKIIAEKMEKEIGMPSVHVEVINERFILKGEVDNKEEYKAVILKASLFLPKYYYTPAAQAPEGSLDTPNTGFKGLPIVGDFLIIKEKVEPTPKDIKVVVYFVEIIKGFEKGFQFQWAPAIRTGDTSVNLQYGSGDGTNNGLTSTISGTISNFIPKLKNTIDHNRARVLHSAAVTIKDEEQGTIKKTTSYPYQQQGANGMETKYAEVGVDTNFTPKILGTKTTSEDLQLNIQINVSQVVSSAGNTAPVTAKDTLNTVITIKSNETAAIGGLIQNTAGNAYNNKPGTDDDVIFNLSRSKSFKKNKSQFVVFVTPVILKSVSEGSEKAKKKFRLK